MLDDNFLTGPDPIGSGASLCLTLAVSSTQAILPQSMRGANPLAQPRTIVGAPL